MVKGSFACSFHLHQFHLQVFWFLPTSQNVNSYTGTKLFHPGSIQVLNPVFLEHAPDSTAWNVIPQQEFFPSP